MMMIDEATIATRVRSLGTLPTVVSRLMGMLNSPDVTLQELERVIAPDVAFSANILRSANSPAYRGTREITAVRDALGRLGLNRTMEIAMSASFSRTIPSTIAGYDMKASDFWRHCIAVAVLTDKFGKSAGFTWPGMAFTVGLLHDVGKLVVASIVASSQTGSTIQRKLDSLEAEVELLGTDHCRIGEVVGAQWNLPREVCVGARYHHDPEAASSAFMRYLACAVNAADCMAHALGYGAGEPDAPKVHPKALERLGVSEEQLLEQAKSSKDQIEKSLEAISGPGASA